MVHGFMGSTRQFDGLRRRLEGTDAELILHSIAGHGLTLNDFLASSAADWQRGVNEHLDRLRAEYDNIYIVSHSMGGLLSVHSAIAKPDKIGGIVAIGFPISVHLTKDWFTNFYLATKPYREGEHPRITAARGLSGIQMHTMSDVRRAARKSTEFLKVRRGVRRELGRLSIPFVIFNFEHDEIVSKRAAGFVRKKLPQAEIHILPESYHFYFVDNEEVQIADEIMKMTGEKQ